jgi:hypothetical protein
MEAALPGPVFVVVRLGRQGLYRGVQAAAGAKKVFSARPRHCSLVRWRCPCLLSRAAAGGIDKLLLPRPQQGQPERPTLSGNFRTQTARHHRVLAAEQVSAACCYLSIAPCSFDHDAEGRGVGCRLPRVYGDATGWTCCAPPARHYTTGRGIWLS